MNEHTAATEALDAEVARVDLLDLNRRDVQRLLAAADNAIEEACADGETPDDATLILARAIIEWLVVADFAELVNARRGVNLLRRISLDATAW